MASLTISDVNTLKGEEFEQVFGNVIEHCKNASTKIKHLRPFNSVNELCGFFEKYLDDADVQDGTNILWKDVSEKLAVLKSHPDLAGRLAQQGKLTAESTAEQRSAGLSNLSEEEKTLMDSRNKRYKSKFGFPFIICARQNKVQSILEGLEKRYNNNYEEEIQTGIEEVKKICKLRILDIVNH